MFFNTHKGKFKTSILTGAVFLLFTCSYGQNDSLYTVSPESSDSLRLVNQPDTIIKKSLKKNNPRIAIISSAIIPGLGQAYNKKFWKIPIIYGGGAAIYWFFDYNNFYFQRFKAIKNGEITDDPEFGDMTSGDLQTYMDNFRRQRDLCAIGMGLLYVANIVDAMVDAYMTEYDISKDLTMKVSPTILHTTPELYSASYGVKLCLRF